MDVAVGLEADLGGCSLAADGFGVQSVCLRPFPSPFSVSGSKLAKNISPVESG